MGPENEADIIWFSGQFESAELPREKAFLYKYFTTKLERAFLKYYYFFGDTKHFRDRTGYRLNWLAMRKLVDRYNTLLFMHHEAKSNFQFEQLAMIESGQLKKMV